VFAKFFGGQWLAVLPVFPLSEPEFPEFAGLTE
jgi:hypothetical protein